MEEIVYSEGYCTNLYLASERINHGTDGFLEILCSTIECVRLICAQRGDDMPEHLVIQTDNTVSQSKNSFAHLFQALLVSRLLFKTVTMNYFMVGHTHEDIDQLFALVVKYILQKTSYQAPAEILEYIAVHLRPRIVAFFGGGSLECSAVDCCAGLLLMDASRPADIAQRLSESWWH